MPPLTSLYTFVVRSDDQSRLYLSPNMSDEHKQLIAYAAQHTRRRWNYFPTQTAAPILLEAGKAYYMEAISNQGPGYWDLGISAKIHNLSFNTYPFNGDNEVQMIGISSVVVKEEHVSAFVSTYIYFVTVVIIIAHTWGLVVLFVSLWYSQKWCRCLCVEDSGSKI